MGFAAERETPPASTALEPDPVKYDIFFDQLAYGNFENASSFVENQGFYFIISEWSGG